MALVEVLLLVPQWLLDLVVGRGMGFFFLFIVLAFVPAVIFLLEVGKGFLFRRWKGKMVKKVGLDGDSLLLGKAVAMKCLASEGGGFLRESDAATTCYFVDG